MYSLGDFVESTFIGVIDRQYDYNQIVGGLYEVYPEEMNDVIELGFAKVRSK